MTLDCHLKETGETETDFGKRVGVSQAHINRIRKGARPSWDTACEIVKATKGAVTLSDLGYSTEAAE